MKEQEKIKLNIILLLIPVLVFIFICIYFTHVAINSSEFDRYHTEYVLSRDGDELIHIGTYNNHPNEIEMFIFKIFNKKILDWNN